ncbi:hypothetical protein [Acinetobacter sp. H1(2024)]|uniref:hypothetical protein n=1 Tax=Acinetobacter sp. H1(2024) TaxID=3390190 RepID=UPI003979E7C5
MKIASFIFLSFSLLVCSNISNAAFYSYKYCTIQNKCKELKYTLNQGSYVLHAYEPPVDEFYIKIKDDKYYVIYKNIFMEGVEVGWAQMKIITNNEKKLVMETNEIFQTLGNYNSIGGGDNFEYIPSKNYRSNMYVLNDFYDRYSFRQYQKLTFIKKNKQLLLDCKSYMQDLDPKNNLSGMFYGVCTDKEKVYFKEIPEL